MQWNLEGMQVYGMYLDDIPVSGMVTLSRVQYGGAVCHTVQLNEPITVYGAVRDRVILDHKFVSQVADTRHVV
ncbi:hypothetical protein UFOVP116_135 [uncultured Caudovirales phage]|uniref:Uncharacterized protein n=1 Tax=uncultured Caudovirales phage TaxID=2100421 RepID=A0A6J5L625_9CAUD|nr:hypothetical protein UFOVP116_135 [uncultured Caudovirales phage]